MDRPTSALPVLPYASSYPDPALLASKLHNRQPFLVRVQIAHISPLAADRETLELAASSTSSTKCAGNGKKMSFMVSTKRPLHVELHTC
ncbi:predicted protein [Plenodomus lingam JN3]|uniref:Uncharacterized protein n=1 Tax=Leptosphaeria maculans (strain JN3 / isolate v23.1.3 / race Av1-4-5-6-7-8) TaxID=985895 RepID=E4ZGM4_LEPMJ|nr:predicted protein [Plenodomus lingam JN3]CBX90444.1 predicted protein [Plenodomus lingam JN3]